MEAMVGEVCSLRVSGMGLPRGFAPV